MLKDSIVKFLKLDSLIANLTGYIETKIELVKIEVKEDLAQGLSHVLVYILLAFIGSLFILFTSMAVALKIGEHLGGFAGFGIVGGFYLIVGIILFISREAVRMDFEKRVSVMFKKRKKK
jgi:hypothetical protein